MASTSFKTKGFTLLELLLVIAVMALLSITALSSIMSSQNQFRFKSIVNESENILRTIRNYALSNKPAPIESAPQYGAVINATEGSITIFGDTNRNNEYDSDESNPEDEEKDPDHLFKTYKIPANSGTYELYNGETPVVSTDPTTPVTLTIFYQPTTANFSIFEPGTEPVFDKRYAALKIIDSADTSRFSYIVLFKESGNPEVLNNLDGFQ